MMKTIILLFLDFMMMWWKPPKKRRNMMALKRLMMKKTYKTELGIKNFGVKKDLLRMKEQASGLLLK